MLSKEKSLIQVIQENPDLVFGLSSLKKGIAYLKQLQWIPRMRDVKVYCYYGPTRTGKSWKAISEMGCPLEQQGLACDLTGIYFKKSHNKWWDGYLGQKYVLIDELPIEASKWVLNYLKQWTGKLPIIPEQKSLTVLPEWTQVAVTCQHSIDEFFAGSDSKDVEAIRA